MLALNSAWKKTENYVFVFISIKTKSDARIFITFQMSFQLRKFLVTYGAEDNQGGHSDSFCTKTQKLDVLQYDTLFAQGKMKIGRV